MAVRAVGIGRIGHPVRVARGPRIVYVRDGQVRPVTKLQPNEFGDEHRLALRTARLTPERELVLDAPGWRSCWVGAGEEKAVFLVVDPLERAFAVEILGKGSYLEGHLAEGHYFTELYAPGLTNVRWDDKALFGHVFSGQIKAREFIYGETLAGPGLRTAPAIPRTLWRRLVNKLSWGWARWVIAPRYWRIRDTYRDAHEANVIIELLPLSNPEKKSHYHIPLLWLEEDGRLHLRFYRLTPLDVRAR